MGVSGMVERELLLEELDRLHFTGDIIDIIPYDEDSELVILQPPARFYEIFNILNDTNEEEGSEAGEQDNAFEDLPDDDEN